MTHFHQKIAALACVIVSLLMSQAALAAKRNALVIGNSAYQFADPLANPVNDARAMATQLERLGFETYVGTDLDKMSMDLLLRDFAKAARTGEVNLFFYAGHGMVVDGRNYLVPIDAQFEDETALDFEAVSVDFITKQMSYADAVNLVFLDACRDNPLSRSLSSGTRSVAVQNGLAEMKIPSAGKGMAIAFATSPGEVALDGEGNNSPFTTALLEHIDSPNTDITEVFSRVTGDVYESTNQMQRPWLNVSLTGSVMLNEVEETTDQTSTNTAAASPSAGTNTDMLEEQKLLFQLARDTGSLVDYEAYLDVFPNGLYASNVRRMIDKLKSEDAGQGSIVTASNNVAATTAPMDNAAATRALSINEAAPLMLSVTPSLQAQIASEFTENDLNLTRNDKGTIQAMINTTGQAMTVDGLWGPGTRRGIASWQAQNGLAATGFFNHAQLELLTVQAQGRYQPYVAPTRRATTKSTGRTSSSNKSNNDAAGAALLGIAIGTILNRR
jgi:peptidoglycan hydrolase-like protein with peptidoglycan-binding domain